MPNGLDEEAQTQLARATLGIVCAASFLSFLDLSVVNIAFPDLNADFPGASLPSLTWVVSGYALMFAALLTPAGRIADIVGRRTVFLSALAAFTASSALCGAAIGPVTLIGGRMLQGAAAATMMPAALGLILTLTPPNKLAKAVGAWSASAGFASVVGPVIGGLLVDLTGWRAVFWINVPLGLALVVAGLRILPIASRRQNQPLPDGRGIAAVILGVGGVVGGLTEGPTWGWSDWRTWGAILGGLALIGVSILRSRSHPTPVIEIKLWQARPFAIASVSNFFLGMSMFAWLLAGPIFLASIWGWTALESAYALTVGGACSMITAIIAGRAQSTKTQLRFLALGCLMFLACCFWMATDAFSQDVRLWSAWIPAGMLGGGGLGMAVTSLGAISAASLPRTQFATGMGMNLSMRQLGGSLGVAVLAVLMSRAETTLAGLHTVYIACGVLAAICLGSVLVLRTAITRDARRQ